MHPSKQKKKQEKTGEKQGTTPQNALVVVVKDNSCDEGLAAVVGLLLEIVPPDRVDWGWPSDRRQQSAVSIRAASEQHGHRTHSTVS